MAEPALRSARTEDVAGVTALVQAAYRGDADDGAVGWTTEADLIASPRVEQADVAALVADAQVELAVLVEDDGAVLGCCVVRPVGTGRAGLGLLAVRPGDQGRGTGRRLVGWAMERARDALEADVMAIDVLEPRAELIAWYERLGFVRTGEAVPFAAIVGNDAGVLREGLRFVALELDLRDGGR